MLAGDIAVGVREVRVTFHLASLFGFTSAIALISRVPFWWREARVDGRMPDELEHLGVVEAGDDELAAWYS